jgi:ankyrin repeat protein
MEPPRFVTALLMEHSCFVTGPLVFASQNGNHEDVAILLKASADVNRVDMTGNTALITASGSGHCAVVTQLLEANAGVDTVNYRDETALICASRNGCKRVVAQLLEAGATVNQKDRDGWTALIWASQRGHHEVVAQLLLAGAAVNHANNSGRTALTHASHHDQWKAVARLLEAGATVNHADSYGKTALMYAADTTHHRTVAQLLSAGATVTISANDLQFHRMYLEWLLDRLEAERTAIINGERSVYLERKCDVFAKPMSLEECGNLGFMPYHQLPAKLASFSSDLIQFKARILSTLKELATAIHNTPMERDRAERDSVIYCAPNEK